MAEPKRTVTAEMEFLADGVSISFLAVFFGMDKRHVAQRIAGVSVVSHDVRGNPKYDFKEAIGKLARPDPEDIEDYVRNMRPNDLPPMLQSEFWNAQLRRQKFMQDAGDLWKTIDVLDMLAEVFKTVRMTMMLMADSVARETELSNRQREIVSALADSMLEELREKLVNNSTFERYKTQHAEALEMFGGGSTLDLVAPEGADLPLAGEPDPRDEQWLEAAGETFG
ncbi:MAG: DUF1441 family protein [Hyphomicrobiaceae bacterium]|nr:MAG: DUF1441 family protein [Hyphomicrobiaceae bacterium]